MSWWKRLFSVARRSKAEQDLEDEIGFDLAEEERLRVERGESPESARLSSHRDFGNVSLAKEDVRQAWGWSALEASLRDFRYALRGASRSPGFAAAVILTLALGIGAGCAIFSLVDAVLLRPLPYPGVDRLISLEESSRTDSGMRTPISPARLADWQAFSRSFEAISATYTDSLTDLSGAEPERLFAASTAPDFFSVLGTPPQLGRVLQQKKKSSEGRRRRSSATPFGAIATRPTPISSGGEVSFLRIGDTSSSA